MVDINTNIRFHVYDIDAVSSYPSDSVALNLSKITTKRELIDVEGVEKETFKMNNINLVMGPINTVRYANEMLNAPQLSDLLSTIKETYNPDA